MSATAEQVRELRARGLNAYAITCSLGIDLSELRRIEDPRAAAAHQRWSAARGAADDAERVFGEGDADAA